MHNLVYSTVLGKVTLKKQEFGWELTQWERPEHLSWKSMRKVEACTFDTMAYDQAKLQALSHYEELLHRTKKWAQAQQGMKP